MNKAEQIICNFISDFMLEHWNELDESNIVYILSENDNNKTLMNKDEAIELMKVNFNYSAWILTEVLDDSSCWTDIRFSDDTYYGELLREDAAEHVVKLNDNYIRIDFHSTSGYIVKIVKKKTKTVTVTYYE